MAQKPSIPKGTRDFNPEQVAKRNYIFGTIKSSFERFGFQPIETPSFENSDTLMGKYGDEGDRLIFKVLDSGEYFEKATKSRVGERQFTFLNFHLFDSIRLIFKKIVEDESFEYENLVSSAFVSQESGYHIYIDDEQLLDIVKDFLIKNKDFFKEELRLIIVAVQNNQSFEHQFNAFYRSFMNDIQYLDFINFIEDKGFYLFENLKSNSLSNEISNKALRYDLTVPFARYVVQHQNEIELPFKRYQIQPVWRADRPQKGRFREFYQCDADVVGSKSLWQEVEFVQLYDEVFTNLGLKGTTIKINNRKILSGIAEVIGAQDKLIDFTVALDKLDKIGEEKVKEEMRSKGISDDGISKLQPLFTLKGDFGDQVEGLKTILSTSEIGLKGIEELEFIDKAISSLKLKSANLQLDVTLARGLNYYTGAIFEVSAPEGVKMGSIGGGGRYDDLTGIFGLPNVSGVGISFGLDRIYLVLEELDLFPETVSNKVDVLFINFGKDEALFALKAIKVLREKGFNTELYPDNAKMKKQMTYANKRNVPYVVMVGEEELKNNQYTLKDMSSGEQQKCSLDELISKIK